MSTNNTENIGFKIVSMGKEDVDNRPVCNFRTLTLEKLFAWIDAKNVDARIKVELKKSASQYPQQALGRWQKTYPRHLSNIQKKLQKLPKPMSEIVEIKDIIFNKINEELPSSKDYNYDEFEDYIDPQLIKQFNREKNEKSNEETSKERIDAEEDKEEFIDQGSQRGFANIQDGGEPSQSNESSDKD